MEKGCSSRNTTTRHAGVVGLWGAPPQRPPGSSPNGNCRNGAILARSKTAPLPVPPSKRMKSPSNIMRQSSLTKLGSMINTAVNKRVGEFYSFVFSLLPYFLPFFSSTLCSANSPNLENVCVTAGNLSLWIERKIWYTMIRGGVIKRRNG